MKIIVSRASTKFLAACTPHNNFSPLKWFPSNSGEQQSEVEGERHVEDGRRELHCIKSRQWHRSKFSKKLLRWKSITIENGGSRIRLISRRGFMIVVKKIKFSSKNRPWCNPLPCPHPVTCPHYLSYLRTTPPQKKDLLGSYFWYAKIILRCQNMFYNSGEVTSDQFNHITLDSISWIFWKKSAKKKKLAIISYEKGGGGVTYSQKYISE